nr:unnamed protein product [Callosobruchus chinensis]
MGSSSGGGKIIGINGVGSSGGTKKKYTTFRSRQRANLSFFLVVMFFAVFGIIVFTEVFFIDERNAGTGAGVLIRHAGYQHGYRKGQEYDENEDYISIRMGLGGGAMMNDETLGALLLGGGGGVPPAVAAARAAPPLPLLLDTLPLNSKDLIETQLPPYPDNSTLTEGSWQNVNGTKYKFFVFSAFFDQRRKGQRIIRVIGATKTRGPERVWCRLWYKIGDGNSTAHISVTVPAKVWAIRENWNLKYSACFATCALPANRTTIPSTVSVVAHPRDPPGNLLVVHNGNNETHTPPPGYKFGVCVKPLHFDYNREIQMLEFLELNRLLGVEHFTFYNHTIGPQVSCILRDYETNGMVRLLPWRLNMVSQKEIRTEGLFAALNDCMYRSMYKFTHVALIDLDEYIVPRYNYTLPQLVEHLDRRGNLHSAGALSFQNAFFYLQWSDDESLNSESDSVAASLVTVRKTRRRAKLHPHKQRSKYICRPEVAVEAGNHFVWELLPGYQTKNVHADQAILHHYRVCEFGGDDCIKTTSVVDRTAYRYKIALTEAVRSQYERLKSKCHLSELKLPKNQGLSKFFKLLQTR